MIARRLLDYFDHVKIGTGRLDLESVTSRGHRPLAAERVSPERSRWHARLCTAIAKCYPEPAWSAGPSMFKSGKGRSRHSSGWDRRTVPG